MIDIIRQVLISWNNEKNQRIKLQKAYFFVAICLAVVAGLASLASAPLGVNILIVSAFLAAAYIINAICWTMLDMIVSKKLSEYTKPQASKKR